MKIATLALVWLSSLLFAQRNYKDWSIYGGGPENIRYSKLDQINRQNVKNLTVAWTFNTGDEFKGSEMQCNPIVVDGVLCYDAETAADRARCRDRQAALDFDPNAGSKVTSKAATVAWPIGQAAPTARIFFVCGNFCTPLTPSPAN